MDEQRTSAVKAGDGWAWRRRLGPTVLLRIASTASLAKPFGPCKFGASRRLAIGAARVLLALAIGPAFGQGSNPPSPPAPLAPPAPPGQDDGAVFTIQSANFSDGETSRGEEHSKLLKAAQTIEPLGTSLFGESVNLFTGSVEFKHTDVSIPGHAGPAVALSRRFVMEDRKVYGSQYLFADWDLDIPYLSNVGPDSDSAAWRVNTATPAARCSSPLNAIQAQPPSFSGFNAFDFWQGMHMNNAAGGGEILWAGATTPQPSTPGPWRWVTRGFWYFSCLPSLRSGQVGEGFQGLAPDGSKYRFDWMSAEQVGGTAKNTDPSNPQSQTQLLRREVRLYPTRIEDRFGNWVEYDWIGEKLTAIRASDGRTITLTYVQFDMGGQAVYDTGNRIASVSDGSRTWTYTYDSAGRTLTRVTRPDGSAWQIDFSGPTGLKSAWMQFDTSPDCVRNRCTYPSWDQTVMCSWVQKFSPTPAGQELTGTMTHPSGAVGAFVFRPTRHARQRVTFDCLDGGDGGKLGDNPADQNDFPVFSDVWALVRKTVTGPGLPSNTWSFDYLSRRGTYAGDTSVPAIRTVTVTNPDGSQSESTFGTAFAINEGQGLTVRTLTAAGAELARSDTTFVSNAQAAAAPFPDAVGLSPQDRSDQYTATRLRPQTARTTTQQGASFSWQVASVPADFDPFANTLKAIRSSSLGFSRTETQTFHHDLGRWVLSQPATLCVVGVSPCASQTDYDPATALPIRRWAFGELIESFTYHPDGALASATDGNGNAITLSSWFRGVPRTITFADGSTRSAVVDTLGQITSTTDELGFSHSYAYDALGRLKTITYPTLDSTAWTATQFSFVPVAVTEFGLPAGHWRHTQSTGAFTKTTYFDARFRPVLSREEDTGNAATPRYVARCFDHEGKETFAGYPVASFTSFSPTSTCTGAGVKTVYDALGRVTSTVQTSELGNLSTAIAYLSGFQTQVTSPLNQVTTTTFQAFDTPDPSAPVVIAAPEGVTTSIARDVFGKPLSLTRSGLYAGLPVSATRTFVYDSAQRLCKRIEPETGATVFAYDPAGNLSWHAEGSTLTGATCDRAGVPIGERIARTYDARDRLLSLAPPGAPATVYGYAADGALTDLVQGESAWTYTYNKRRLLIGETLSFGDGYAFAYSYTALAHLASVSTPSGLTVDYAPNALGQPTKAGTFATGASYFPDGSLKGFSYGNGLVRTVTQNARLLPANVRDAFGSTVVHEFGYGFDKHGNVTNITDVGQAGLQTRSLTYDTRDRLVGATAPQLWGNAAYAYDPLDNLRVADQGSRQHRYTYDSQWRLSTLTTPAGGLVADFAYDGKGNQTRKGSQIRTFDGANRISAIAGEAYAYDGHGRRTATWRGDGSAKVEVYTQDGKLGFVVDSEKGGGSSFVYLAGLRIAEDFWRCDTNTHTATYFHSDILGSPVAETDAARNVLTRTHYAPYGEALNRTVDGPGYTGHMMDAATGLVYAQQRYYDPVVGRFLSIDPVGADADSGGNFNRYWYANNNPYTFVDPDGEVQVKLGANLDVVVVAGGRVGLSVSFDTKTLELSAAVSGGPRLGLAAGAAFTAELSESSNVPAENAVSSTATVDIEASLGPVSFSQDIVSEADGQVRVLNSPTSAANSNIDSVKVKPAVKVGFTGDVEFEGKATTSVVRDSVDAVKKLFDSEDLQVE